MAARANRAMFIIDLGVPRNVNGAVGDLYNVYLYNVDDLTEIVDQNKKARESEIPRAEAIIAEHVAKFAAWQGSVHAVSLLNQLREHLQRQRADFLRERQEVLNHLSPEDRQRVARLTEELLDRILEEPGSRLRGARELRRKLQNIEAVRDLFDLDKEKS